MSHISQFCTEIVVNSKSVMENLMACAVEMGASIKNSLTVEGHNKHDLRSGFVAVYNDVDIGVTEENGKVVFYADHYFREPREFEEALTNKFRNKCIQAALEEEGFQVQVEENQKQVVFTGVG